MRTIGNAVGLPLSLLIWALVGCSEASSGAPSGAAGNLTAAGSSGSHGLGGDGSSGSVGVGVSAGALAEGGSAQGGAAGAEATAGDAAGGADGAPLSLEEIVAQYETWHPLSDKPFDVSAAILSLCRSPTASEQAFVESEHSGFALRHWASPLAYPAVKNDAISSFVEGSAFVKQKLAIRASDGMLEVVALGIMVKRSAGFNAANGDWEFAYFTEGDGILADAATQAACGPCHASSSAKDFVFLDDSWRL